MREDSTELGSKDVQVLHEVSESVTSPEMGGYLGSGRSRTCRKNRGHAQFVPAAELCADHVEQHLPDLPQWLSKQDVVDVVKCHAQLTVRLTGHYISDSRPGQWKDVGGAYPLSEHKGKTICTSGSGWVWYVLDEYPGAQSWDIFVWTAQHLVYGIPDGSHERKSEASMCDVTFFDDGVGSPVTVRGGKYLWGDTDRDYCFLKFTISDAELAQRLKQLCYRRKEVMCPIQDRLKLHRSNEHQADANQEEQKCPVVAIGYPHSKKCYVTFGYTTEGVKVNYTNHTCKGYSGSLVLPLNKLSGNPGEEFIPSHPHGGTCAVKKNANESSKQLWVGHSVGWELPTI